MVKSRVAEFRPASLASKRGLMWQCNFKQQTDHWLHHATNDNLSCYRIGQSKHVDYRWSDTRGKSNIFADVLVVHLQCIYWIAELSDTNIRYSRRTSQVGNAQIDWQNSCFTAHQRSKAIRTNQRLFLHFGNSVGFKSPLYATGRHSLGLYFILGPTWDWKK
jgi:hypothetical protein